MKAYFFLSICGLLGYGCSTSQNMSNNPDRDSTNIAFNTSGINRSVPPPVNENHPQGSVGMGSPDMRGTSPTSALENNLNLPASSDSSKQGSSEWAKNIIGPSRFIQMAYQSGFNELGLARTVLHRNVSEELTHYAEMMIKDYTRANERLMEIAKAKNLTIEPAMVNFKLSEDDKKFEEEYLRISMEDHTSKISIFERALASDDTAIRNFATQQLPVLKKHLAEAMLLSKRKAQK